MLSIINRSLLAVTIIACIAQVVYWFGKLPDVIPSHFDGNGNPDGEMTKLAFFALMSCINALLLIGFPLLGKVLKKVPASMINLPNKEYWLSPERREETLDFNTQFLVAMGWMTSWLMLACTHLTVMVALGNRQSISPEFYYVMVAYALAIFAALAYLFAKFRVPQESGKLQSQ